MDIIEYCNLITRCRDYPAVVTAFREDGRKVFFRSCDPEELADAVIRLNKRSKSVYLDRNLRRPDLPPNVRGTDDDVAAVNAITADFDLKGPAHKEPDLPETKEDVLRILETFPEPTCLIDSGHGIYAEWFFREPVIIDTDETREQIDGLFRGFGKAVIEACGKAGFKADNVFTMSHMFRAPGSDNRKLETPAPCSVIEFTGSFYTPANLGRYFEPTEPESREPFESDSRTAGSAERIMERCAFMQKLTGNPEGVTEPEWHAMCSNAVHAADGPERFHEWSSLYSGYSFEETEYKISRALAAKRPCTCAYIHDKLGFPCPDGGCGVNAPAVFSLLSKENQIENLLSGGFTEKDVFDPYVLKLACYAKEHAPAGYGRIKQAVKGTGTGMRDFERAVRAESEKSGGAEPEPQQAEIDLPGIDLGGATEPRGYRISADRGVAVKGFRDGVPSETVLCHEPVVITRRLENIDNRCEKLTVSSFHYGRWQDVTAPRSVILSKSRLVSLADSGLPVSSDNADGMVKYLSAYEAANGRVIPFSRSIGRIGWAGKEFYPCVTDGEIVYDGDDSENIAGAIKENGDFKEWLETAKELRQQPFSRILLAASFASPLLELLQNRVIIIHLWHVSKSGKTAALKFALSVWGDPNVLMGSYNTTRVGIERRAGTLRHLPMGIDELQVLNSRRLSPSEIVYSLGNGFGRTRGAKDGGLQETPKWRNCVISTGEQPLTSENSMDGVNTRVMELYGRPLPDPETGRRIHITSENSYGFAGVRIIRFIINEILPEKERIRRDYDSMREKLQSLFTGIPEGPGPHLDNAAVLALADSYSSECLFGMTKTDAVSDGVFLGAHILRNLKEQEKEDVVERAWHFVEDWVAANRQRFSVLSVPCLGVIEEDGVYIISSQLRN